MITTVKYRQIDGVSYICDVDRLLIDPVATAKQAQGRVDLAPLNAALELLKKAKENDFPYSKVNEAENNARAESQKVSDDLKNEVSRNPVHFKTRGCELVLPPNEIKAVLSLLRRGIKVVIDVGYYTRDI